MEEMLVKSDSNGEILLFYVDENGENEQGVVTTIQNIEEGQLEDPQQETYILEEVDNATTEIETDVPQQDNQAGKDRWADGEVKRLLIFYIDNKETFLSGLTKKRHLWTVACKTMLTGKRPISCDMKIRNLRRKYAQICVDELKKRGNEKNSWPYYDLCHQAFHDDSYVKMFISEDLKEQEPQIMKVPAANVELEGTVVIKKVNPRQTSDQKVEQMLKLYLKHKKQTPKEYWQKHIWEKIAIELGEDSDYWHKRFLNYKNHYIKMLERRAESSDQTITWPYMTLFDKIYKDDEDFKWKQTNVNATPIQFSTENDPLVPLEWDEAEKTVLVKYCFDCFDEFQDETIPNGFLWHEVERLLDKPMNTCKAKYDELRSNHLDLYISGGYTLQDRKPIAILFDNLISKEIELELSATPKQFDQVVSWKTELIDDLVQFFLNNVELFKDMISHFVCWAAVSKMLCQSVRNCRDQWRDLTSLYKSILDDKKEDPEMQIDWRYTDLFDRIFDYGMDTKLLEGYEKEVEIKEKSRYIGVKKLKLNKEDFSENELEDDEYDEKGFGKNSSCNGDPKQFKILEYYQKNKTKFTKSQNKKNTLWEALAKQIGLTSGQCAHWFRNLKQVYTSYVQREMNKPEKPILWPYYALCKKVFGYRVIQHKLKSGKDYDEGTGWSNKEIKQLIDYVAKNFDFINNNIENITCWSLLSNDISKSTTSCRDKFLELRKYYRQLKSMKEQNKECKVIWKYYKKFDEIYGGENEGLSNTEAMDVDYDYDSVSVEHQLVNDGEQLVLPKGAIKTELHDEDYQCIIVIPEGQELAELENAQIIIKNPTQRKEKPKPGKTKWTKKSKTKLLELYLEYIQTHITETIKTREMWKDIAKKIPGKSPFRCKDMYTELRKQNNKDKGDKDKGIRTPYTDILEKISSIKPKFWKCPTYEELVSQEIVIKDVSLPEWKVEKALKYYLQHIEEFLNPRFEKKYAWLELANHVSIPVAKVYMKINYLKQFFNSETNEVAGIKVELGDLIKEILEKEFVVRIAMASEPQPMAVEDNTEIVCSWSDEETELLLKWYLENLEKFKNPKFVPSYLWMEASILLNKTALECSKKMTEIRTQYSNMMKENPDALLTWRYHKLCQKIYGTGKKGTPVNSD